MRFDFLHHPPVSFRRVFDPARQAQAPVVAALAEVEGFVGQALEQAVGGEGLVVVGEELFVAAVSQLHLGVARLQRRRRVCRRCRDRC